MKSVKVRFSEQTVHLGDLILVNQRFPFRGNDTPDTLVAPSADYPDVCLERKTSGSLSRLIDELGGWKRIVPVSGWRSMQEQQEIWDNSLRDDGLEFTQKFVAIPGHSEHQTGLAIDLGLAGPKIDFIRPAFPYSGICQEFRNRMAAYGFVERYPAGKESVTGIAHEPWHFRYVGCPHAEIMQSKGFVLEEYHEYLKAFPFGGDPLHWRSGDLSYSIFYMTAQMAETATLELEDGTAYDLSGDNEAGVIVTLRRCAL